MKTFTFEVNGYCFYFECETIEQLQIALNECEIIPDHDRYGELIFSKDLEDLDD